MELSWHFFKLAHSTLPRLYGHPPLRAVTLWNINFNDKYESSDCLHDREGKDAETIF